MKHPHSELIKQWLEDTSQEIELNTVDDNNDNHWMLVTIEYVIRSNEHYKFRIKPKPDKYEHLRQAIRDGKKIEYFMESFNEWIALNLKENHMFGKYSQYRIHDPFLELKSAKDQGKRIVFQLSNGSWVDINDEGFREDYSPDRYKIVDYDKTTTSILCFDDGMTVDTINLKVTKSGITGTITAEVVE
jgi:hypothetical protein